MSGAPKDSPATPDRLRQEDVFHSKLDERLKSNATDRREDRSSAREDDAPEREGKGAKDREETEPEDQRESAADPDELPRDVTDRLKRLKLDGVQLPPEVKRAVAKLHKSLESDHGRKSQDVAKARKDFDAVARRYETWKPTMDRYESLPESRRKAIDRLFAEDQPEGDAPEESDDKELDEHLADLDDDGKKIAKRHLDLAVKRATKESGKREAALQERLEKLEQQLQRRDEGEKAAWARSELDAFHKAHPEYEGLDDSTREIFEDAFAAHVQRAKQEGQVATRLPDFYKRFFKVIDDRASGEAKERVQKLADRSQRAPVQRPGAAGASKPQRFDLSKGHRAVFDAAAQRKNVRF